MIYRFAKFTNYSRMVNYVQEWATKGARLHTLAIRPETENDYSEYHVVLEKAECPFTAWQEADPTQLP